MLTPLNQLPISANLDAGQIGVRFLLSYSGNTRDAYSSDLRRWMEFCAEQGFDPMHASRAHVDAYAQKLREVDGRAPSTVNRVLATLSGFYGYAVDEGLLDKNPVGSVRRQRVAEGMSSTGLTDLEARLLIREAMADSLRSATLISLLTMNGLRISEALSARVEDLGSERNISILRITRKGGMRATIPLADPVVSLMETYLAGRTSGPIFATSTGTPMDRAAAWKLVRKLAARAVPHKAHTLHPHDLRHTFATLSLDAGATLRDVQDAMDHKDPRTTRSYDRARNRLDNHPTFLLNLA